MHFYFYFSSLGCRYEEPIMLCGDLAEANILSDPLTPGTERYIHGVPINTVGG